MKIHKVKTRLSNSWVIEDGAGILVADVATRCEGTVLRYIEESLHRPVTDVALVVCTHDDPDHIGGVMAMARSCRAALGIPHASQRTDLKLLNDPLGPLFRLSTGFREAMRPRMRQMYMNRERAARYEQVANPHLKHAENVRFVVPRHRLRDGDRLEGFPDWQVIHTPGHSWDSVCFFHEPSRGLITGDTLLGSAKKGSLVHPAIYDNPLYLQRTMIKLQKLNPQRVYPGHGSTFDGEELLAHL
ncbi:MAG: MBL fold metallo-hydrolase [Pseudomonadales bacterium]|nr:MBL fold metallo-hydrolase [Pseudomonadales bacterium]